MKQLLTLTFLTIFGLTYAQVPSYVPSNGLVGWWPFNGNANDESGNGNNGTVNGAMLTTDRNGLSNAAYSFDGSTNYISVDDNATLDIPNVTVSAWYWAIDYGTVQQLNQGNIVSKREQSGWGASFQLALEHSSPINEIWGTYTINGQNGWVYFNSNSILTTLNWIHVVYSQDNVVAKLFINGAQVASTPVSGGLNVNDLPMWFGARPNAGSLSHFFHGSLDDIGIWDRALTVCEIQDLYHTQLGYTDLNAGADQSVCNGSEVTLNGSGGNGLTWNNGVLNGVAFAPNQTSNYVLTGSDSLGCIGTDTVLVTILDNTSSTINQAAIDSYTLNGQTYTQSGTYTQVLTAANGCDSTITLNLELDFNGIPTSALTSLKLYPNPVQEVIHIDGLAGKEFEYEVLSIDGKLLQKGKSQGEIAVKELRKGNYVLRIGQQQVSFVKQ